MCQLSMATQCCILTRKTQRHPVKNTFFMRLWGSADLNQFQLIWVGFAQISESLLAVGCLSLDDQGNMILFSVLLNLQKTSLGMFSWHRGRTRMSKSNCASIFQLSVSHVSVFRWSRKSHIDKSKVTVGGYCKITQKGHVYREK